MAPLLSRRPTHGLSPAVIRAPETHAPESLFRICRQDEWEAVRAGAAYRGSDMDRRDGFIHLSSGPQVLETLQTHFRGVSDLVVLRIDPSSFGPSLRWEPSRGGGLFPHLYGALPLSAVLEIIPVPEDADDRRRLFLDPEVTSRQKSNGL